MDQASVRNLTSQLAEDLGWLEDHCRRQGDHTSQAGELRLAEALVRNSIGPFLDQQPAEPLHVAVVGGAGAGKSTVANMLSGTSAAEANPQAGFTRHPIAYTTANGPLTWSGHAGFLGPLQRMSEPAPANFDADVYQVRRVPADQGAAGLLPRFVVWDCPDMTTWAASGYVFRLLEIAGLADVIVYVASDERYNDEAPTQFLSLLLQAGKPVVCCLMKMREENVPAILDHFQKEVLAKIGAANVPCLAIPHLSPEQLADPVHLAAKYRIPLLNQVTVLGEPPEAARRRGVRWAANYLQAAQDRLMGSVRRDLAALQEWRRVVLTGQIEFDSRYRREYLASEKYERFDEALVRLIDLLDLPGVGRTLSNALWVLRWPYRQLKSLAVKALRRPEAPGLPERPVLEQALAGWLDGLRKEAVRRAGSHPVWAYVEEGFRRDLGDLGDLAHQRFEEGLRNFRLSQADEIDKTARAIYEELEKSPAQLNTLRGAKFGLDLAGIAAFVVAGGINWHDVILVPLAASMTHQLIEWLGKGYVDSQREAARNRQQGLETKHISGPLAEWLAQWPATGGSAYERLNLALRRIPSDIRQLNEAVTKALGEKVDLHPMEFRERIES